MIVSGGGGSTTNGGGTMTAGASAGGSPTAASGSGGGSGESTGGSGGVVAAGGGGGSSGSGTGGEKPVQGGAGGGPARSCAAGLVPIPAKNQSFVMGLDLNDKPPLQGNGQPWACYLGKHKVTFTYDFCMDSTLVTQEQFSKVMGFNPSKHQTGDVTLPVDQETWYDAVLYCNAKSVAEGLAPAYTHGDITFNGKSASNIANLTVDLKKSGYRLPTNAEYEYAERANTVGLYFFSPTRTANITELGAPYAWYSTNSKMVTQPVGGLKPNPWGLYDIIGNLFEWEHDWEGPYGTTDEVDPTGPATGSGCGDNAVAKMAKGGSWHTDVSSHMMIGYHYKWSPTSVHAELGFRCVATSTAP